MARRILAFIALLMFAGIAYGQCNSGVCKVDVTVTGPCTEASNIHVQYDPLIVDSPNNIEWTIQTPGYVWVPLPNGITSLPTPQFTPHATGNNKKYMVHDDHSPPIPKDYKYDVHLQTEDGKACAVKDPIIRNG